MAYPTRQQAGILLLFVGTVFLAFSFRTRGQYDESDPVAEVVKRAAKKGIMQFSATWINLWLFRSGLILVAVGSLLQW